MVKQTMFDLSAIKIGDIVEFESLCICIAVCRWHDCHSRPLWPPDEDIELFQFKSEYLVFERIARPKNPIDPYAEKIFQTARTNVPRGKLVPKKDLSLYTHWEYKTPEFFTLIEED
jgi:hypothetical protein